MSIQSVNKTTGDTSLLAGSTLWADSPIGSILPYGGASAPSGWFLCQGQAVSRTTYSELFAVIGESFGAGDGSTTFNLPDMRESVPKGAGETGKTVGAHVKSGGLAVGEFLDDRVQTHKHTVKYKNYTVSYPGTNSGSDYGVQSSNATYSADKELIADSISNARAGATTEVKSVGVNYIIKAKMVAMPSDFMSKVDEAVEEAVGRVATTKIADDKISLRRMGNIVEVRMNPTSLNPTSSQSITLGTIPIGYRPTGTLYFSPIGLSAYVNKNSIWRDGSIVTSGEIALQASNAADGSIATTSFYVTYTTGDNFPV